MENDDNNWSCPKSTIENWLRRMLLNGLNDIDYDELNTYICFNIAFFILTLFDNLHLLYDTVACQVPLKLLILQFIWICQAIQKFLFVDIGIYKSPANDRDAFIPLLIWIWTVHKLPFFSYCIQCKGIRIFKGPADDRDVLKGIRSHQCQRHLIFERIGVPYF